MADAGLGALIGAVAATLLTQRGGGLFATVLARWWTSGTLGALIVGGLLVAWLNRHGVCAATPES